MGGGGGGGGGRGMPLHSEVPRIPNKTSLFLPTLISDTFSSPNAFLAACGKRVYMHTHSTPIQSMLHKPI